MKTDFTKISTEELWRMHAKAFSEFYKYATRYDPDRDYSKPNQRFAELEKASDRLNAIADEILRRNAE